jgi:DNA ligase (NAD+)
MTKKEYYKLVDDLIRYSDSYYKNNKSLISDKEFDILLKKAEAFEAEHPDWARPDSPTQGVGSDLDGAVSLEHTRPMLSLENTYNKEEVRAWFDKMTRHGVKEFIVEPKYDGNSFAARYVKGKLVQGLTRGDGKVGEDITQNLLLVEALNGVSKSFTGEVRGEIIMTNTEFKRLNTEGQYANPRNLASGTLKLKDPEEFKKRKLTAYVYWLEDESVATHKESLETIKKIGLDSGWSFVCKTFEEVSKAIDGIWAMKKSGKIDIELDGAVLKVNDRKLWKDIGGTSKYPHWAKAYKYDPETAVTKVKNVEFWVGHAGKITPVAILEPVELSGSTVQKASLNNKAFMEDMDIKIGDSVNIKKAAEIIPYINYVIKEAREDGHKRTDVKFPTHCPSCGTKLSKHAESHADFNCMNESCKDRVVGTIVKYCRVLEIDGFGEIVVGKMYDAGVLKSIEDLYSLQSRKLAISEIDRMSADTASKLSDNVEKSKSQPLEKLLAAISIRNAGEGTAKRLVKHYSDIDEIMKATALDLTNIEDIGEIVASSIVEFFKKNKALVENLKRNGVNMKQPKKTGTTANLLNGKSFCITGALSRLRSDYEKEIDERGGKNASGVSKATDYLVTNDQTTQTSKLVKARELGVKIISEAELTKMLGI